MRKIRKVLYQGLVHGVNQLPSPGSLYCLLDWPEKDWAEEEWAAEPICCMECLAKGPAVRTIFGIDAVLDVTELPDSAQNDALHYVWDTCGDFRLWRYAQGTWSRVSPGEAGYLQKILYARIQDVERR